jgi:hypothetical protein
MSAKLNCNPFALSSKRKLSAVIQRILKGKEEEKKKKLKRNAAPYRTEERTKKTGVVKVTKESRGYIYT